MTDDTADKSHPWRYDLPPLLALAQAADRKASEYHDDGEPVATEMELLIDAVYALYDPTPGAAAWVEARGRTANIAAGVAAGDLLRRETERES